MHVMRGTCFLSPAPSFLLLCRGCGSVPMQCPWALKELLREALQGAASWEGALAYTKEWFRDGRDAASCSSWLSCYPSEQLSVAVATVLACASFFPLVFLAHCSLLDPTIASVWNICSFPLYFGDWIPFFPLSFFLPSFLPCSQTFIEHLLCGIYFGVTCCPQLK